MAFADTIRGAIRTFDRGTEAEELTPLDFGAGLRRSIEEQHGEQTAIALHRFIEHRYHESHSELPHWSAWYRASYRTAHLAGEHDSLALPQQWRNTIIEEFRDITDIGELEAQMHSMASAPQSDWDVEIYVRHHWDPLDEDSAPVRTLREVITITPLPSLCREAADAG